MPERRRRWRTVAHVAAWGSAIVAVAVVLLVFVFPTRTYLSQRHQLALTANSCGSSTNRTRSSRPRSPACRPTRRSSGSPGSSTTWSARASGVRHPPRAHPADHCRRRPGRAPSHVDGLLQRLTGWIP